MPFEPSANLVLRGVLALLGAFVTFLGLNVALGGIATLGWQGGGAAFYAITDPQLFAVRDSHIRFIGGVWLGLGLLMLAGTFAFRRLRPMLVALTGMIFIGGLARLSGESAVLFSPGIGPSFAFELLGAPLLGLWFSRAERSAPSVRRPVVA